MTLLDVKITGTSVMELNVIAISEAYEQLELTTKVLGEDRKIPTWLFGRKALEFNISPPRVTWIPITGTIEPPNQIGGKLSNGGTTQLDRSLQDRLLTFDVHCNGLNFEQAENLMSAIIAATRAALGVGTTFGSETWVTEQEGVSDVAINNTEVRFQVNMRMPVLDEQKGLTVIDAQTHTEDIDNTLDC